MKVFPGSTPDAVIFQVVRLFGSSFRTKEDHPCGKISRELHKPMLHSRRNKKHVAGMKIPATAMVQKYPGS